MVLPYYGSYTSVYMSTVTSTAKVKGFAFKFRVTQLQKIIKLKMTSKRTLSMQNAKTAVRSNPNGGNNTKTYINVKNTRKRRWQQHKTYVNIENTQKR